MNTATSSEEPCGQRVEHPQAATGKRRANEAMPAGSSREARLVWSLPSDSSMVMRVRLLTRTLLTDLGLPECRVDDGELMAGELATNAIRHAVGPFELRADCRHTFLVSCAIFDGLDRLPPLPAGQPRELTLAELDAADPEHLETGRGLTMVHSLCGGRLGAHITRSESVSPTVAGKAVWFTQQRPSRQHHQREGCRRA